MTIDEARNCIGRAVVYKAGTPEADEGVISSAGHVWVFVRYGEMGHAMATDPVDLTLTENKSSSDEGSRDG